MSSNPASVWNVIEISGKYLCPYPWYVKEISELLFQWPLVNTSRLCSAIERSIYFIFAASLLFFRNGNIIYCARRDQEAIRICSLCPVITTNPVHTEATVKYELPRVQWISWLDAGCDKLTNSYMSNAESIKLKLLRLYVKWHGNGMNDTKLNNWYLRVRSHLTVLIGMYYNLRQEIPPKVFVMKESTWFIAQYSRLRS